MSRPWRSSLGSRAGTAAALAMIAGLLPLTTASAPAVAAPEAGAPAVGAPAAGITATQAVATWETAAALPDNVQLVRIRTSLLGRHEWYQQVRDGRRVVGGWYARHFDEDGDLVRIWDGRLRTGKAPLGEPLVSGTTALRNATAGTEAVALGSPEVMVLPPRGATEEPRLVWAVDTVDAEGAEVAYVDAGTGDVIARDSTAKLATPADTPAKLATRSRHALVTGRGRVFDPNPVVALQNQRLRDHGDRTTTALTRAYRLVALPRLRAGQGLAGRWARIVNADRAVSSSNRYVYSRTNDRFEQVVAYHAVDTAQAYLQQLGFRAANARSQKIVTNRYAEDNSFYNEATDVISFGSGGVDDGEDVEVIWHEYGHAIQDDQVPGFGSSPQAGAIGEGFGDYFAVTMSEPTARATRRTPLPCVADWDAVSYDRTAPHCLRRVDGRLTYEDRMFDVHHDGRIWSRALWDIRRRVDPPTNDLTPRDMANTLIVEAHFWMNPRITMPAAARITVRIARDLYGADPAAAVRSAFEDRGILPV